MKRTKVIYALLVSAMMCVALIGCGSETKNTGTDLKVSSDSEVNVSESTEASKQEVAETTEAPKQEVADITEEEISKKDWLTENGYVVNGVGTHTYTGEITWFDDNWSVIGYQIMSEPITFEMTETDNGDGTKTIVYSLTRGIYYGENVMQAGSALEASFFLTDRYTGTTFSNGYLNYDDVFKIACEDGTVIDITNRFESSSEADSLTYICIATMPSDYDGLVYGVVGNTHDVNVNLGGMSRTLHVTELPRSEGCDILFFGEVK